jgi:hypothetical protein
MAPDVGRRACLISRTLMPAMTLRNPQGNSNPRRQFNVFVGALALLTLMEIIGWLPLPIVKHRTNDARSRSCCC